MILMEVLIGQAPRFPIPTVPTVTKHLRKCCATTYERITLLDDMVVLNAETFTQYQGLKFRSMCDLIEAKRSVPVDIPEDIKNEAEESEMEEEPLGPGSITKEEESLYFDTYSEPLYKTGEAFFDTVAIDPYQVFDPLLRYMDCVNQLSL